jgi:hypothetical protein
MRRLLPVLLLVACAVPEVDDPVADWNQVLVRKRIVERASQERALVARQRYVDALRDFVARHPEHQRAREVYRTTQLDYARQLTAHGRYDEAVAIADNVIERDGAIREAVALKREATERRSVHPSRLASLRRGMSESDVEKILGSPPPGWKRQLRSGSASVSAWYYRRPDGGTAGVFFRAGRLFHADGSQL